MAHEHTDLTPVWRRAAARATYMWGLSLHYWGLRTSERSLFQAAIGSFTRAVELWPAFAISYYRRGVTRGRELGEYSQGIDDLTRALALHPDWADAYLQRGLLQRFHGDPHLAATDLRRFLELAGDSPWRSEAEHQLAQIADERS